MYDAFRGRGKICIVFHFVVLLQACLVASSSGSRVGHSFCSNRNLIVKIKARVLLKYQLGVVDYLARSPLKHTKSGMWMGKSHVREGKRNGRIL